jgi:uncharacterized membrane protein YfcA
VWVEINVRGTAVDVRLTAAPDAGRPQTAVAYLSRRALMINAAVAAGAGAVAAYTFLARLGTAIIVGYGLACALYVAWVQRRRIRQRAAQPSTRFDSVESSYLVTEVGVRQTNIYGVTQFSWRQYARVVELRDQFLLMLSSRVAHVLPKVGLAETDLTTLRAFFTGQQFKFPPPLTGWQLSAESRMRVDLVRRPDATLRAAAVRYLTGSARRRWYLAPALLIIAGAGLIAVTWADSRWLAHLIGVVLLALGVAGLLRPVLAVRRYARAEPPAQQFESTLTLTDTMFYQHNGLAWLAWRWESFVGSVELPGQILLLLSPTGFVSVPTGGLSPEDLHVVRTFLANRDWRVALTAVQPEPAGQ